MAGPAYSGSSLLGNALGAHPAMAYVGEVLSQLPADVAADDWGCWLCLSEGRRCPRWTPSVVAALRAGGPSAVPGRLASLTGADVVIDGSKEVRWIWSTAAPSIDYPPSIDYRVLMVLRSPFAFVDSACREERFAAFAAANVWRDTVADALRTVNTLSLPVMAVRYEQLAFDPATTLRAVCRFVGVDFDPVMLHFWDHRGHATGGNPGAFAWYEGFAPWFSAQLAAIAAGEGADAPRAMRHWLHAYVSADGVDAAALAAARYDATVASYSQRTFGGWVDDKWRRRLSEDDVATVMGTPGLVDLATLGGYDLARLLTRPSGQIPEDVEQ